MKKVTMAIALMAGMAAAQVVFAQALVGQSAPAFSATDANGKAVSLADYKGKYVVLEWVNKDCPFSKKHYDSGNIAATQKHAAAKGAAWLAVSTSAAGPKDMAGAASLAAWMKEKNAAPNAIVLDAGPIGRAYGAKTTPHMYLIDPAGKLVYAGAIDSKASSNPADIPGSVNYVTLALDEAAAGKALSKPVTQPYGCSVKYGSAG